MKRKLISTLLATAMVASVVVGCGSGGESKTSEDATLEETGEEAEAEEEVAVTTVGPDSGTHFDMWVFVELHSKFYADMVNKWNEANPDKQIQITFTTYPFADMHNKLTMALQTGEGAPDICDIERGQFPNFTKGEVQFYPLNDAIEQYRDKLVDSRLEIYSKGDQIYGAPFHVGATVMYYNDELLSSYGIDYKTIKTWDDYTEAAKKLNEASNGEVKMTSVDTGGTDWLWLGMAEYQEDWSDDDGKAIIPESMKKTLEMQKEWMEEDLAMVSPDGQVDTEGGFQNILDGNIASFPKALWYMSRFLDYMPEEQGKWAIAPCPVFEEGQPRSVGIGGTGTVVTMQSENPELAAEWLAYAKCSEEGNIEIWNQLGFDVCNTDVWTNETITKDTSNKYISFFKTNPFDVLNEIKEEIGAISVNENTFTLGDYINTTTLNEIFEDEMEVEDALQELQDYMDVEQG